MKSFRPYLVALILSACTVHSSDAPAKQPSATPEPAPPVEAPAEPSVAEPLAKDSRAPLSAESCRLPPETGRCRAMMRSFHYDAASGGCKYFVYGGCDGNANRFPSVAECLTACGSTPEFAAITDLTSGASTIACQVGESYYATGAKVTLEGGGTCTCRGGKLEECTKPYTCAGGQAATSKCAEEGPSGCVVMETACPT